jgi:IS5 family transposase
MPWRRLRSASPITGNSFASHRRMDTWLTANPRNSMISLRSRSVLGELLHGEETRVYGDQAYQGRQAVIHAHAPHAKDFTNRRYRYRGVVDEVEGGKNRTKSSVRAKVEHPFHVLKRMFGYAKVRYRGLAKNAERLWVTCGLTNLFMVRRRLLRA